MSAARAGKGRGRLKEARLGDGCPEIQLRIIFFSCTRADRTESVSRALEDLSGMNRRLE